MAEPEVGIDTSNDFFVGVIGDDLACIVPIAGRIPKDKALRLAAYIVAMMDHSEGHGDFKAVLTAIENV